MNNIEAINSWLEQSRQSATHICTIHLIQLVHTSKDEVEFQHHWLNLPLKNLPSVRGARETTHTLLPHNIGIMWVVNYYASGYTWTNIYTILTNSMEEFFGRMSGKDRLSIAEEAFQVYKRGRSFRDTTSIANKISDALSVTAGVPVESIATADLF